MQTLNNMPTPKTDYETVMQLLQNEAVFKKGIEWDGVQVGRRTYHGHHIFNSLQSAC